MSEDDTNKNHMIFHIREAIRNAIYLSGILRERNNIAEMITNAKQLKPIPIHDQKENFHKLSQEINGIPIHISIAAYKADSVDGYWKLYANKSIVSTRDGEDIHKLLDDADLQMAHIILSEQPSYCWERYIACKELMHCYLHSPDTATHSLPMVKSLLITHINSSGQNNINEMQSMVDHAAYYGAIEMMMPRFYMPILIHIFQELSQKYGESVAYERIARKLRIPLKLVEYRIAYNHEFEEHYSNINILNKN